MIVLQEMFDVRGRRRLLRELCPPYTTTDDASRSRRILGLVPIDTTGGLLVLSRLPIASSRFVPHPGLGAKPDERVGRKGTMIVRLDTPLGIVTLVTTHLYAGTKSKDASVRSVQIERLLDATNADADGGPVVLAGDINASPTAGYPEPPGPENAMAPEYAALMEAGFADPLPPNPTPAERSATWVPSRNRYAALPYQETKTDQRYDYVLVRAGMRHEWCVTDARPTLDDLSDHVGVQAELVLRHGNTGAQLRNAGT